MAPAERNFVSLQNNQYNSDIFYDNFHLVLSFSF